MICSLSSDDENVNNKSKAWVKLISRQRSLLGQLKHYSVCNFCVYHYGAINLFISCMRVCPKCSYEIILRLIVIFFVF